MKKYILILAALLSSACTLFAQNRVSFNAGYGNYLGNSENSAPVTNGQKFRSHFLYGLSLQKEDLFGLNLMLDYSYNQIKKNNVFTFTQAAYDGTPLAEFGGDLTLVSHNFDLAYVGSFSRYFSYGAGPSFSIVNRIFELQTPLKVGEVLISPERANLYDKLASSHLGVNGFLMFTMPVFEGTGFFVSSKLKFRYTHSVWFDAGLRNLDNYSQEFTTGEISLGAGYSF
ncbi:MAG TPA: hypothetical protein VHO03_08120 [Ignavibacteriales bacterium]|nr:hypothetical protein [Ignavibacteriales bacterium]